MRRVQSPPPKNLDALLNTVTNAVGILLILLAVTQLGVGKAVDQIQQRADDVGRVQVKQTEKQLADSRAAVVRQKQELQKLEAALPAERKTLESQRKDIATLTTQLQKNEQVGDSLGEARKQLEDHQKALKDLEAKIAQSERDAAELSARLEKAALPSPPPEAKIVSLPNPRAAAPNMRAVEIVCHHGRAVPFSENALRKIAQDRIDRAASELRTPDGIDCGALQAIFEQDDIGNAFFRLKIVHDGKLPELVAIQREDVGDTAESVASVTSLFQDVLRAVDRRQEWIRFRVFPDSFETYLAARDIASRPAELLPKEKPQAAPTETAPKERRPWFGLSVGWQPYEADFEDRLSLGLPAGVYCSGYKPPAAEPGPKEKPPTTPSKFLPKEKPQAAPTEAAPKERRPLAPGESPLKKLRRKTPPKQPAPKEKPPAAPAEPAPVEKPKAAPAPGVEPAKPAKPSLPNDDLD